MGTLYYPFHGSSFLANRIIIVLLALSDGVLIIMDGNNSRMNNLLAWRNMWNSQWEECGFMATELVIQRARLTHLFPSIIGLVQDDSCRGIYISGRKPGRKRKGISCNIIMLLTHGA